MAGDLVRLHTIRAEEVGHGIECCFDGAETFETRDGTFVVAGGVGLWTRADAASFFDDLRLNLKP